MDRRNALGVIGSAALAATGWPVRAQNAAAPMRIIVPYSAGGQSDVAMRLLAVSMQKTLNRTVVVENRPGAAGLIGTQAVRTAAPDGETLLYHNAGIVALPMMQKSANYDVQRDFEPVASTCIGPTFLMITDAIPAKTVPEFLDYARANPGKIECANSGINSGGHIAAMLLEKLAKIELTHIPYKGSAEVATAMISGQVKMQISTTTDALNPHIKAGRIRVLAAATRLRTALAPNVLALGEFVPGYALDGWYGLLAPAKTPLELRERLAAAVKIALDVPETRERFQQLYLDPRSEGPKEFSVAIADSIANFRNIVNVLQLTPQ